MLIVLGSVNADLLFKVETLPRPGETVLCPSYVTAPGGKGSNQAAAAAKAGARTRFVGHLGDDANGPVVRRHLEAAGLDLEGLAVSKRPTAVAVIGVDAKGENSIIVASAANLDTRAEQVPDAWLEPGTTVLCQNEIDANETVAFLRRAKAKGCRTILNLAPAGTLDAATLDALDVLIVNEHELQAIAGDDADAAETLAKRHGLAVVVTLGAKGACLVTPEGAARVPPLPVAPVDTTGAGDAFVGALAAALDAGADLIAAVRRGNVAGALACMAVGAQAAQADAAAIEARLADLPA